MAEKPVTIPKMTLAEIKQERIDRAAKAHIDEETAERNEKTARLRAMRIEAE
ncbi:hypothetical protein [Tranquillimonas alkanivorans]|uniref:Uncharacterized protein n=1 Tax=Tranquillimonas alkanivorans TaxID=441119 RepID=A0A1I5WDW7_9RHOB|nr:hypothetical protein [Tranquillimonas alkanivorans]SFQ17930.1 hypothetical protein SAMN04488047_14419 [Tranquillimonas alkanivorans]